MVILPQQSVAIVACLVGMLCWGSWSNAQKLVGQAAPVAAFYRAYNYGIALTALLLAFTLGSFGGEGRAFLADVRQADGAKLWLALAAGVVFNMGNALLVAGIDLSGLAIAMPVGSALALVIGLVVNYIANPEGNLLLLSLGGGSVVGAIACAALAYRAKQNGEQGNNRGVWLALAAGVLNGFFFRMVSDTLAPHFAQPTAGTLTPYSGLVLMALGILVSSPGVHWALGRITDSPDKPQAAPASALTGKNQLASWLSGSVWAVGMLALLLASEHAGDAISFGLSQGATIVAVAWAIVLWKEFADAPPAAFRWLWAMVGSYVAGIGLIVAARLLG